MHSINKLNICQAEIDIPTDNKVLLDDQHRNQLLLFWKSKKTDIDIAVFL